MRDDFLESSREINTNLKHLNAYTEELKKYTLRKQNSVLNEKEEIALDKKIDAVNELFTTHSDKIKEQVRKNQRETVEMKRSGSNKGIIELRELHTFRHGRDLADALRHYQNVQCEYRQREKDKLRETYLIANPKATDRDLEMLTDGSEGEALLASAFALGSHSAQGILLQAKDRKKKIEKIVETINMLVELIEDIDRIVKKNTHVVDHIYVNMAAAEEHTGQANQQLSSALVYERRAMWIKRTLLLIVLIFIVVVIGLKYGGDIANIFRKSDSRNSDSRKSGSQQ